MNNSKNFIRISPFIPAVASLVFPGLGHIILGLARKGILLFASFGTICTLAAWRIHLLAHREQDWITKTVKAFSRRPVFITLLLLLILIIWIWNTRDAYSICHRRNTGNREYRGSKMVFVFILIQFFLIGWQIAEIDPVKMVHKFPDAIPPLMRILWPWEAAVYRERIEISAGAYILADDTLDPPADPERIENSPYIRVSPSYGHLATMDSQGNIVDGSHITLYGEGFDPDSEVHIYWKDSAGNVFRPRVQSRYASVTTDGSGSFEYSMTMPYRLTPPSAEGRQLHQIEARQLKGFKPPVFSEPLVLTISLIIETIFMGMMATFFGILFSIPVSFLAARNLMSGSVLSMIIYYITRTLLNIIRAIEPLIWALIAVVWVGLGPFAGILALTIHTVAALGKLYSEAIENIDAGQIEAIQATGATKLQIIIHAVIPQMIPPFVSFTIYRWDINVRMSTVIGMVGGGGIGFLLVQYIRLLDYKSAGIAVWFIAITVAILDYVSSEIRNRYI